jgi:GTP-binding protein
LKSFGAGLLEKPLIVIASKIDVANAEKLAKLKRYCSRKKLPFYAISAVTGEGIEKLKFGMAEKVNQLRSQQAASKPNPDALPA